MELTQKDIFAAIPDTPENAEVLDQLYTDLADSNIEITASEADEPAAVELSDEWGGEDGDLLEEDVTQEDRPCLHR